MSATKRTLARVVAVAVVVAPYLLHIILLRTPLLLGVAVVGGEKIVVGPETRALDAWYVVKREGALHHHDEVQPSRWLNYVATLVGDYVEVYGEFYVKQTRTMNSKSNDRVTRRNRNRIAKTKGETTATYDFVTFFNNWHVKMVNTLPAGAYSVWTESETKEPGEMLVEPGKLVPHGYEVRNGKLMKKGANESQSNERGFFSDANDKNNNSLIGDWLIEKL